MPDNYDEQLKTAEIEPEESLSPEEGARRMTERALVKRIDEMVADSERVTKQLETGWRSSRQMWRGNQWINRKGRKKKGKSWTEAVVNRIFPIIEQKVSMMTQNNPRGVFLPQENSDVDYVKDLESLVMWRANRINIRALFIRGLYDSHLYGHQTAYVFWDDSMPGNADANIMWLDPRQIIIDPKLTTTNLEDGAFAGFKRRVSLDYVKWHWPEHAERVQASIEANQADFATPIDSTTLDDDLEPIKADTYTTAGVEGQYVRDEIVLTSMWFKDYSQQLVEIKEPFENLQADGRVVTNAAGQHVYSETGEMYSAENAPVVETTEDVYPFGRFTIKAGNVVLEDGAWEGQWELALGINSVIPHHWWGMDEIEQLRGRQDVVNDLVSNIEDHLQTNLHPRIIAETGAVSGKTGDLKTINSRPNGITWMNDGRLGGIQFVTPPPLPADVYKHLESTYRDMEHLSGVSGVSSGRASSKVTTATEIALLERATQGRVGLASALFDEFVSRVYLLLAQVIQKHYDVGRIVRVVGADGTESAITITQKHKEVKFDVQIEAGSTLPFDKDTKRQKAIELNNVLQGAYLPELLDAFEVPNKEEVLGRFQQWQMFLQFMEQQQAAAQQEGQAQ